MLRAIIKHETKGMAGDVYTGFITLDFNSPELETALNRGGRGEDHYELYQLIGVEFLPELVQMFPCNGHSHASQKEAEICKGWNG